MSSGTEEISRLQTQILELKKQLTRLRREQPAAPVEDYALLSQDGGTTSLSQLFGGQDDLLVIHNMGRSCDYCTLWTDGLTGVTRAIESRCAFVVVSPDPPEVQSRVAAERGWPFRTACDPDRRFTRAMGFWSEEEGFWPGVSAFRKSPAGEIERISWTYFGPGDDFAPIWHLFDLLAEGAKGWEPGKC
jgi:predicted dithiol-disulfide oxidoreductase (DUF899 family)